MDVANSSFSDRGTSSTNIAFASKAVRGKSSGDDMETYSGYTSRSDGFSARTGRGFRFSDRGDLLHHEMLYPDGAVRFADAEAMWQAVNGVERHPNAQFAFEIVLPLTPDPGIGLAHNLAMIRQFAHWYRVRHGVPVQIDVHSGIRDGLSEGAAADEGAATRANPHVHLLIPTRTLGPEGFGKKTRHLNPPFFAAASWRKNISAKSGAVCSSAMAKSMAWISGSTRPASFRSRISARHHVKKANRSFRLAWRWSDRPMPKLPAIPHRC